MESNVNFLRMPSLHLGPMSRNVIAASVAYANENSWPICLIASRRQIDSEEIGGGYVNGLTTEKFALDLSHSVKKGQIFLARDHGGPYQRSEESLLSLPDAMDRVERSFLTDIIAGFNVLHIDPEKCVKPGDPSGLKLFTSLTCELISRCNRILLGMPKRRSNFRFEVGTDEGVAMDFSPEQWEEFLGDVKEFCAAEACPMPISLSVPLGTKVKETQNVGGLALDQNDPFWIKRVKTMLEVAGRFDIKLKLHNVDYISMDVLKLFRKMGVSQFNVAPELGVIETRALLHYLRSNRMDKYADIFLDIAYKSRKWERWMLSDSKADDEQRAIIAGHYVFFTPEYLRLLDEIRTYPAANNLDTYLIDAISKTIKSYHTILE